LIFFKFSKDVTNRKTNSKNFVIKISTGVLKFILYLAAVFHSALVVSLPCTVYSLLIIAKKV